MKRTIQIDNSLETQETANRRIELARPGNMRHQYHKKLERQILISKRQMEEDRR